MDQAILDRQSELLAALGMDEEPMGFFYTDQEPDGGMSPKPGNLPSAADEAAGQVDWPAVWGNFSCVIGNIWRARKKGVPAYFSAERFGCLGGAFYLGFNKPQLESIVHYVSTGIPGAMEGERYLDSPQATRGAFQEMDPPEATGRFAVFKPLSQFTGGQTPLLVTVFARPEPLCGLHQLAMFVSGDMEVVMSPWGAGCSDLVTWPRNYLRQGRPKAVVGGWDPSCRKFYKTDELSLAIPWEMYGRMLDRWRESFLTTPTWELVRKKVARSAKAWGEGRE